MKQATIFFCFLILSSPAFSQGTDNQNPITLDARVSQSDFVPGVVLVKFKDDAAVSVHYTTLLKTGERAAALGIASVDQILQLHNVSDAAKLFRNAERLPFKKMLTAPNGRQFEQPSLHNIYKLSVATSSAQAAPADIFSLINELKSDPNVVYAEPDYIYSVVDDKPVSGVLTEEDARKLFQSAIGPAKSAGSPLRSDNRQSTIVPNDPLYPQQWYIPAVQADAVWDSTTGDTSQIIAFLDTGIDWHHPDLADNIWTNTAEADGIPGADDDGDGYVDDVHGWDFINNDNNPSDDNSHGTHVAGIACAVGNNGIGIAGVDWHAKIMPIKVFQSSGRGDIATIVQGVYYAVAKGATVINMSFGSYARSLTMDAALEYAYAQCVLVAAAGNDGASIYPPPLGPFFPAALSYVLGVQATTSSGGLAGFSNFDPDGPVYSQYSDLLNYELRAPGDGIISTIPNGNYRVYSGTSMATPVVAGAVALYRQLNPGQSQEQMWGNLINTTSGNLNIFAALSVHPNPQLWFVSHTIVDTLAGDNNNGMVDAGETIQLWFTVRNTWGQSDSVFVGLRLGEFEDTSVAHILNPVAFVGSISPYAERTNEPDPFEIQISPSIAHDRDIVFQASLWYAGSPDTVTQRLVLTANHGQYLAGVMDSTLVLTPDRLWLVYNSFRVGYNGTLIIGPGTQIDILSGKYISVRGQVLAIGTPDSLITVNGPGGGFVNDGGTGKSVFKYCRFNNLDAIDLGPTTLNQAFANIYNSTFTNCAFRGINDFENNVALYSFWGGYTSGLVKYNNFISGGTNGSTVYWPVGAATQYNNFVMQFAGNIGWSDSIRPAYQYNSFIYPGGTITSTNYQFSGDKQYFLNEYWGTTDSSKIESMVYDFWDSPLIPILVFQPLLSHPPDSCHGIVWKVLVDGIDPQDQKKLMNPIGVGPHRFDVYFNRPMDTTFTPQLSFGVRDPFTQQAVADSGRWSADHRIWTANKTVKLYTGDGINTIRVAGAKDLEGFEIPVEDMRFSFLIDAAGTSSEDFVATPGLGKVELSWVKPDVPDILGYNMYRFTNVTDTTYTDTTLISKSLVTDTTYTDFNVTPGKNYYYTYKVVRTDFSESDYSKIVGTKALTSAAGDANGDLSVNVLDVVSIASYILDQHPTPFIFAAADVNGDSAINVLDIVGTINIILHGGVSPKVIAAKGETKDAGEALVKLDHGTVTLSSVLPIAGIQLKVAGIPSADDFASLGASKAFEIARSTIAKDTAVFVLYSLKGNMLNAGENAILQFNSGTARVIDAVISAADGRAISAKVYNNGEPIVPDKFVLDQNFPNPFNPSTTIRYGLPQDVSGVEIVIFDLLGRKVRTLSQPAQKSGYYNIVWNGRTENGIAVATGVYFYQMRVHLKNEMKIAGVGKMLLLK
jgi:subtilisin family serine protease